MPVAKERMAAPTLWGYKGSLYKQKISFIWINLYCYLVQREKRSSNIDFYSITRDKVYTEDWV